MFVRLVNESNGIVDAMTHGLDIAASDARCRILGGPNGDTASWRLSYAAFAGVRPRRTTTIAHMELVSLGSRPRSVSIKRAAAAGVAMGLLAGCSGSGTATVVSPATSTQGAATALSATDLCQSKIGPQATVSAAYLTTVAQVRHRRHSPVGPHKATSPVVGYADWDALSPGTSAAWCVIKAGTQGYEATAVAQGARMVTFLTSPQRFDPGPSGPVSP